MKDYQTEYQARDFKSWLELVNSRRFTGGFIVGNRDFAELKKKRHKTKKSAVVRK